MDSQRQVEQGDGTGST